MPEATIIINGTTLSEGQSMTVRVALNNFAFELQQPSFREGLGKVGLAYQARLNELITLICEDLQ